METIKKQRKAKEYRLGTEPFPIKKQIMFFSIGWIGFRVLAVVIELIVGGIIAGINHQSLKEALSTYSSSIIVNSLAYLILLTVLLLISYSDTLKLIKSFKQYQSFIAAAICVVAIFVFNYQYSYFLAILRNLGILEKPVTDNANQSSLVSLEQLYPFTSLIIFGFVGPICEEITYRVGLFSLLKRKSHFLAYFVTIVVFAFIHFNYSTTNLLNEILNLPYYAFAAAAFSFTYDHFGFAASTTAHITNNVVSLVLVSVIH